MIRKAGKDTDKLDNIIADARRQREQRGHSYREQALKLFPWICGRCSREFTRKNLQELTVHHKDHNHDNNPDDGSNWELLCVYCHDNEHSRYVDEMQKGGASMGGESPLHSTYKPFAGLQSLLRDKK